MSNNSSGFQPIQIDVQEENSYADMLCTQMSDISLNIPDLSYSLQSIDSLNISTAKLFAKFVMDNLTFTHSHADTAIQLKDKTNIPSIQSLVDGMIGSRDSCAYANITWNFANTSAYYANLVIQSNTSTDAEKSEALTILNNVKHYANNASFIANIASRIVEKATTRAAPAIAMAAVNAFDKIPPNVLPAQPY